MQTDIVPLPDSLWLQNYYKNYKNPKLKIEQLVRKKSLIRLKRGRYIRDDLANRQRFIMSGANALYGPSYISFLYALRWYGMIPEYVPNITSATCRKNKKKRFDTEVGSFFYRDVPETVYHLGVTLDMEGEPGFLIACPEKALCDQLYTAAGIRSYNVLENFIFEDLRIDVEIFNNLDMKKLDTIACKYKTKTHEILGKYIKRRNFERSGRTAI